jgi:hypothetical protein
MEISDFRAQLEVEHTWRQDEIRFFQNQCAGLQKIEDQEQFRRALVLMLYAHFEGFCKFALNLYVSAINDLGIKCSDAHKALVVATLNDVFTSLRNGEKKAPEFKRELPEDTKLHRFALDIEFIERAVAIMERIVKIPDGVVDMESNLKPIILRKNLFRLGLPYKPLEASEGNISKLLEYRNKIAHGESKAGIKREAYDDLSASSFKVMTMITQSVTDAFSNKHYLATAA